MLSPSGDPLTLWPFPARREDLETLFPDQAEIEDPLREWRRNRGRQNTEGDGGLEAKDRGLRRSQPGATLILSFWSPELKK